MTDAYITGFRKTAEAYGVDPDALMKVAFGEGFIGGLKSLGSSIASDAEALGRGLYNNSATVRNLAGKWNGMQDAASRFGERVGGAIGQAGEAVRGAANNAVGKWNSMRNSAAQFGERVGGAIGQAGETVRGTVATMPDRVYNAASQFGERMGNSFANSFMQPGGGTAAGNSGYDRRALNMYRRQAAARRAQQQNPSVFNQHAGYAYSGR